MIVLGNMLVLDCMLQHDRAVLHATTLSCWLTWYNMILLGYMLQHDNNYFMGEVTCYNMIQAAT